MIVESHPIDPAILRDITDRDLGNRLLKKKIFQRLLQRSFRYLRHNVNLPIEIEVSFCHLHESKTEETDLILYCLICIDNFLQ